MKCIVALLVLAGLLLCAGCTTPSSGSTAAESQANPVTPNMLGNWTGSAKGYIERAGYRDFSVANLTMSVTEQHDRFFAGTMTFPLANGSTRSEAFAGVIWTGGKSFRIVEYASGHDDGIILSENEIEMVYMDDNDPSFIMLDTLKRGP